MNLRQHNEEQLKKDYDLLKKLEDKRRFENDPREQGKLEADIIEIKQRINESEREIQFIKQTSTQTIKPINVLSNKLIKNKKKYRAFHKTAQTFIQWIPLVFGSGFFIKFLLEKEWILAILMFPITTVTAVWAAYSKNFISRLQEVFSERGKNDADAFVKWIDSLYQTLQWQTSFIEDKYKKCQANACRDYTIDGFHPSGIFIPMLEEVFVPLELSTSFTRNSDGDMLPMFPGFQRFNDAEAKQGKQEDLNIWDFLSKIKQYPIYRHIAILAWGGYGKTTLLRNIAFTYAYKPQKVRRSYKAPYLIPFLLYLRKWQEVIALDPSKQPVLPSLIADYHIPDLPEGKRLVIASNRLFEWVEELLENGDALIMFDGFDEIADNQRKTISKWISKQMENYPRSIFIITSRPGGYNKDYIANRPETTLRIKAFNSNQRRDFIKRWYLCQEKYARGGRDTPDVEHLAVQNAIDLNEQIEQRSELTDMAKNPLLLNLIAAFHRFYPCHELPQRRTELYQEICKLQLSARPLERRIRMLLPPQESLIILQCVALEMVKRNKATICFNDLAEIINHQLSNLDEPVNLEIFLRQIVDISELIVEQDSKEYEFAHLSFQSYLAAAHIKFTNQESLLIEHYKEVWWRETILLYSAQVNPSNFIRQLCKIRTATAISLAYDCLRESLGKIDPEVEKDLKSLEVELQMLSYRNLKEYLKNEQWEKADMETCQIMIQTLGQQKSWFQEEDLLTFSCQDLQKINQLWTYYSKGHFGFSVQKEIYLKCGCVPNGQFHKESWEKFGQLIGWWKDGSYIQYCDVTFDLQAERGHLPAFCLNAHGLWGVGWVSSLIVRLIECKI